MRTVKYERLRPQEIVEVLQKKPIAYLAVGPLEWHGPAMPYGTDPISAYEAALAIAERTGGVVLPTVYVGTERERTPEVLEAMGFEDTSQYIIGQDFPANSLPSLYFREEIFCLIIREYLRLLADQGFRLIVIVNGHGAINQITALNRLAVEFSNERDCLVHVTMAVDSNDCRMEYEGHATRAEHAVQLYLYEDDVDLSELPAKPEKLKNNEWGIDGAKVFALQPNADKTVEEQCDPRDATSSLGEEFFWGGVNKVVREVEEIMHRM